MSEIDITFHRTCEACPEQYNIDYPGGTGYMRLRHGYLRLEDGEGNTIFERVFPATPEEPEEFGFAHESAEGIFESDGMRSAYLAIAARKLMASYKPTIRVVMD